MRRRRRKMVGGLLDIVRDEEGEEEKEGERERAILFGGLDFLFFILILIFILKTLKIK